MAGHGSDRAAAGFAAFLTERAAGTPIYGTFLEGENIYGTTLTEEGVVVMGNEGRGISQAAEPPGRRCRFRATSP